MRKLKKISTLIILIIVLGCARGSEIILESKDVQSFEVVEKVSAPTSIVKISGLAFHSALAVKEVTTTQEGDAILVCVHLVPTKKNLSGNFSHEIVVPATIKIIYFGREKTVIWKRGIDPVQ